MKAKRGNQRRAAKRDRPRAHTDSEGRVHLELHRDPSGAPFVALTEAIFEEAWQNDVAQGTANTAYTTFAGQPTVARAVELAQSVMKSTSNLVEGFLGRAPSGSVACKAGCDHCCHQMVGVTPPEALAIFSHLKATRSRDELANLATRVAAARETTRGLSSRERFSPEHPCVFLESGRCSIYEARPLSCRGVNSLDADECARRLRDPEARADFLSSGAGSHSYQEPIRAFHAVSAGLQLALSELHDLDMRPLDLIAAMHLLMTGGESIPRDWISGGAAFEPALGGDTTGERGAGEMSGAPRLGSGDR